MHPLLKKLVGLLTGDAAENPMDKLNRQPSALSAVMSAVPSTQRPEAGALTQTFQDASDQECILGRLSAAMNKFDAHAVAEELEAFLADADTEEECITPIKIVLANVAKWDNPDALFTVITPINANADAENGYSALIDEAMKPKCLEIERRDPLYAMTIYRNMIDSEEYTDEQIDWFVERISALVQTPMVAHIADLIDTAYEVHEMLEDDSAAKISLQDSIIHLGRLVQPDDRFRAYDAFAFVAGEMKADDPRYPNLCRTVVELSRELKFTYAEAVTETLENIVQDAPEDIVAEAGQILDEIEAQERAAVYDDAEPMTLAAFKLRHEMGSRQP